MATLHRLVRGIGAFGAALVAVLGSSVAGCGTDPVNPDGCKDIEDARCKAVAACPGYAGFDVDACKRFYRDQCLHGLAAEADPGDPAINTCVRAIDLAGGCALAGSPTCDVGPITLGAAPCTVIEHPEQFPECSFLTPPNTPTPDAAPPDAAEEAASAVESGAEVPTGDAG